MDAPQLCQQESDQDDLACGEEETAIYRPAELSALGLNWKRSFDVPHSCRHCSRAKVISNQRDSSEAVRLRLAENILELRQALDDNCALFEFLLGEHKEREDAVLLSIFDIDGSGKVQAEFRATPCGIGEIIICVNPDNPNPHRVRERTFKVIMQPDSQRTTLTCDPAAPESFKLCRGLLSACLSSHPLCRMPPSSFMPTRLLRIGDEYIRLVETSDLEKGEQHRWCALSYVWGGNVLLKTTYATLSAHMECISLEILPQTFRDAINVCRSIGIEYLWVDALCIVQDSQEDLREEINHMPEVYQYATVTICAASATSVHDGFLHRRGYWYTDECPPINIRVETDSGEKLVLFTCMTGSSHTARHYKEPISRRAWTYQEYRLSPRILNYQTRYLEWKCRTRSELLGVPATSISNMWENKDKIWYRQYMTEPEAIRVRNKIHSLSSSTSWYDVVHEYSKRAVSLPSDKLRALSAVARIYHLETGKEYLAGLWKEDIPTALCWRNGPKLGPDAGPFLTSTSQRPREYRAPSWSWASIDTPVHYWHEDTGAPQKMRQVQVLSAGITPTYPNGEFDSIASAFLVLRGSVRAVPLTTPIEMREFKTKDPTEDYASLWVDEVKAAVHPDAFEDQHETLDTLWFLLLTEYNNKHHPNRMFRGSRMTYRGLVLKSVQAQSDTFSRIGHFRTTIYDPNSRCVDELKVWTHAKFFDSFEDRTITLI